MASSSNTHVGPKFTLDNVVDVDSYRARRIHDEDAPKIVELGQAWSELGPRPIVKSFSSSTVKKPTKLPRISKKKMARAESSPGKLPAPGETASSLAVENLTAVPEGGAGEAGEGSTQLVSPAGSPTGGRVEDIGDVGGGRSTFPAILLFVLIVAAALVFHAIHSEG